MEETKFVKGLYPKAKNPKAPEFVLSAGSINCQQMMEFCQEALAAGEDWINYDVLAPKDPTKKPYAKVNTWKPEQSDAPTQTPQQEDSFAGLTPEDSPS